MNHHERIARILLVCLALLCTAQHGLAQRPVITIAPEVGYAIVGKYFGPFHTERASDCSFTDATMDLANMPVVGGAIGLHNPSSKWRLVGRVSRGSSRLHVFTRSHRGCPGTSTDNFQIEDTNAATLWTYGLGIARPFARRGLRMEGEVGIMETSLRTRVPVSLVETAKRTYRDLGLNVGLSFGALAGATVDVQALVIRTGPDMYDDVRVEALAPRNKDGDVLTLLKVGAGWRFQF